MNRPPSAIEKVVVPEGRCGVNITGQHQWCPWSFDGNCYHASLADAPDGHCMNRRPEDCPLGPGTIVWFAVKQEELHHED